jgi:hypothetical protein
VKNRRHAKSPSGDDNFDSVYALRRELEAAATGEAGSPRVHMGPVVMADETGATTILSDDARTRRKQIAAVRQRSAQLEHYRLRRASDAASSVKAARESVSTRRERAHDERFALADALEKLPGIRAVREPRAKAARLMALDNPGDQLRELLQKLRSRKGSTVEKVKNALAARIRKIIKNPNKG